MTMKVYEVARTRRNEWDFSTWCLGALINRTFPVGLDQVDSGPI